MERKTTSNATLYRWEGSTSSPLKDWKCLECEELRWHRSTWSSIQYRILLYYIKVTVTIPDYTGYCMIMSDHQQIFSWNWKWSQECNTIGCNLKSLGPAKERTRMPFLGGLRFFPIVNKNVTRPSRPWEDNIMTLVGRCWWLFIKTTNWW